MASDKFPIDVALVRRLVAEQFPQWAELPISPVAHGGWDNRTFHLGEEMTVRLPSAAAYRLQVEKEQRWLPVLAPQLPLPIPMPLAKGEPAAGYPWPWSIYRWIEGEVAERERIADLPRFARSLADFLVALERIDATGGPEPGPHNFYRGGSLKVYDGETREAIVALQNRIDTDAATAIWDEALAATWHGPPVWVHGDVSFGNLLVRQGQLSAVIDFSSSGVGDPACDLSIAWTLFASESREVFRAAMPLDEGTWARGRGWTLWKALITYAAHPGSNSREANNARRILEDLIGEWRCETPRP